MKNIKALFKSYPELKTLIFSISLAIITLGLLLCGISNKQIIEVYSYIAIIFCIIRLTFNVFKKQSFKELAKMFNIYFVIIVICSLLLIFYV